MVTYRGICLRRTKLRTMDVIGKATGLKIRTDFLPRGAVKKKTWEGRVDLPGKMASLMRILWT